MQNKLKIITIGILLWFNSAHAGILEFFNATGENLSIKKADIKTLDVNNWDMQLPSNFNGYPGAQAAISIPGNIQGSSVQGSIVYNIYDAQENLLGSINYALSETRAAGENYISITCVFNHTTSFIFGCEDQNTDAIYPQTAITSTGKYIISSFDVQDGNVSIVSIAPYNDSEQK